jgi:tetratricopeptide (TPR) repeat protein
METEISKLPQEFRDRLEAARQDVAAARASGDRAELARALTRLGNIERRPPLLREVALKTYTEAVRIYRELEMPLETGWSIRHIGIIQEDADRLDEAERSYDEALALYRKHETAQTLDYANAVRYVAVIKARIGKREEAAQLWEEAARRYDEIDTPVGVAEAADHLTLFALDEGDLRLAREWFATAETAASAADDGDTYTFISEVKARFVEAEK